MNRYEIQVVGHLDARRARAFGAEEVRLLPNGDSTFFVSAVDMAAIYGLLARLRDAGLVLVAVTRRLPAENDAATNKGSDRS